MSPLDRFASFVTAHTGIVVLVMLALTAGVALGIPQLETAGQTDEADMFPETDASIAADYVAERYGGDDGGATTAVYVRETDGDALTRDSLLETLHYQREVLANDSVAGALAGEPRSVASRVATTLHGGADPSIEAQIAALEGATDAEVADAREAALAAPAARSLLPSDVSPGTTSVESHRVLFRFDAGDGGESPSDAQRALFEAAEERPTTFTLGEHAMAVANEQMNRNTMALVVPIALVLVVAILAVTYRDPVDSLVGLVGVVVSIVWMFGILGWLGVGAGMTMVIGPVLVAGLSIDFSFHVFNRYREQRGPDEGLRRPMARGLASVAVALGLVTVTAAVGFLANVVNPVGMIRDLGIGITLGIVSSLVVFLTLVPALKVGIDATLERAGVDRRREPLGHGRLLRPVLSATVSVARYGAPLVLVVALVAGGAGVAAWGALEEEQFQAQADPAAEWKQDLPGPLAWEDPAYNRNRQYVADAYRSVTSGDDGRFQVLLEGDVTADGTLQAIASGTDRPVLDEPTTRSPVTVIRAVADENPDFAATVATADTSGDGVPDRNLAAVYDHLFAVAPDRAAQVIERTDGEYRSLRVVGPAESAGLRDDRTEAVESAATAMETDGVSATAVSATILVDEGLSTLTDGILAVLVLAVSAVGLGLVVAFRLVHGRATLGVVTALPIALVIGLVVSGMALLSVPLTLVTALLMSLVVGLGIDYAIHVSDRFAQELDRGQDGLAALETAVTGTGGALLGSALTSSAAFLALLVHPHPQLESFGILVILALAASLLASVVVLPSLLVLWLRLRPTDASAPTPAPADD